MDLNNIIENDTGRFELKHPSDGAPLGVFFTLAGPEHPVRRKIALQASRELRRRVQKAGKLVFDDPEEDQAAELDRLVASTLAWEGVEIDGKPLAFSAAVARDLYSNSRFAWVRRQVAKALDDVEVFIGSSSRP